MQWILSLSSKTPRQDQRQYNQNNTKKRKFQENVSPDSSNDLKENKRFCRFGAGHEETAGKGDTPGFECNMNPTITKEGH